MPALLAARAQVAEWMKRQPGFISAQLHQGIRRALIPATKDGHFTPELTGSHFFLGLDLGPGLTRTFTCIHVVNGSSFLASRARACAGAIPLVHRGLTTPLYPPLGTLFRTSRPRTGPPPDARGAKSRNNWWRHAAPAARLWTRRARPKPRRVSGAHRPRSPRIASPAVRVFQKWNSRVKDLIVPSSRRSLSATSSSQVPFGFFPANAASPDVLAESYVL